MKEVLTIIALCIVTLIVLAVIVLRVTVLWFNVQLKKNLPKPSEVRTLLETTHCHEMISHLPAFLPLGTPERVIGNEEVTVAYWRWADAGTAIIERILLLRAGKSGYVQVTFSNGVVYEYHTKSEMKRTTGETKKHRSFELRGSEHQDAITLVTGDDNIDHVTTILHRVRPPAS